MPRRHAIKTLVAVEGHRWAIEDSFETAKNEFGLDHNETRSWHGWHRHVSLVMLAFAMMAAIRHQANRRRPKKQSRSTAKAKARHASIRWSVQEIRRIAVRSHKDASSPPMSSHGRSGDAPTKPPLNAPTSNENATVMLV